MAQEQNNVQVIRDFDPNDFVPTITDFNPNDFEVDSPVQAQAEQPGILQRIKDFDENTLGGFGRRILSGPNEEEMGGNRLVTPGWGEGQSLLPDKTPIVSGLEPESYWPGFAKGLTEHLYENLIQPLGTGSGLLGASAPGKLNALPEARPQLALPSAPSRIQRAASGEPSILPSGPGFKQGEMGTVFDVPYRVNDGPIVSPEVAASSPLGRLPATNDNPPLVNLGELRESNRLSQLDYGPAQQYPDNVMEVADPDWFPTQSGDVRGGFQPQTNTDLDYPLNVVPNTLRPRSAQNQLLNQLPEEQIGRLNSLDEPLPSREPDIPVSKRPRSLASEDPQEMFNRIMREANEEGNKLGRLTAIDDIEPTSDIPKLTPIFNEAPEIPTLKSIEAGNIAAKLDKPVASSADLDPKSLVLNWTRGREAAKWRGILAAEKFKGLKDETLVDAYQKGNRQGPLTEVQRSFDGLFRKEQELGLIDDDKYRENYLRQYWDYDKSSPEAIKIFESKVIGRNPAFTKDRTFESYAQGRAAGMVPKYKTIPEIYEARVAESYRALKNKELYDTLEARGWVTPTRAIHSPGSWEVKGPFAGDLRKYINNYLSEPNAFTQAMGKLGSKTKNIYLAGGIPKTKYNMHLYNTARADIKLAGFGKGLKEALSDPTGNKALEWFNQTDKSLLPELIEHGYQFSPVQDFGGPSQLFEGTKLGKVIHTIADAFESPLFQKALPVLKFKRAQQVFAKLEPKMGREAALDAAARISNEFYGGIEKSLRNKSGNDLARFAIIAPDWAEAKLRQAYNEWRSTGRVLVGRGNPEDKLLATSMARGSLFPLAGAATSLAAGHELTGSGIRETAPISLGEDVIFPTLTTADESMRVPLGIGNEMLQGNLLSLLQTEGGNRISPVARTPWNLLNNQNYWGGPLSEEGIPITDAFMNIAAEASRPIQHQGVTSAFQALTGQVDPGEAFARGLELPVQFRR